MDFARAQECSDLLRALAGTDLLPSAAVLQWIEDVGVPADVAGVMAQQAMDDLIRLRARAEVEQLYDRSPDDLVAEDRELQEAGL